MLLGEDARDGDYEHFSELGGVLLPRPVNFQGPDIDPYLPWVREVDIASMMASLSEEIGLDTTGTLLPSGVGSSANAEATQPEVEHFDVKGNVFLTPIASTQALGRI